MILFIIVYRLLFHRYIYSSLFVFVYRLLLFNLYIYSPLFDHREIFSIELSNNYLKCHLINHLFVHIIKHLVSIDNQLIHHLIQIKHIVFIHMIQLTHLNYLVHISRITQQVIVMKWNNINDIPSTEGRVLRKKLKPVCLCQVKGQRSNKKHVFIS